MYSHIKLKAKSDTNSVEKRNDTENVQHKNKPNSTGKNARIDNSAFSWSPPLVPSSQEHQHNIN